MQMHRRMLLNPVKNGKARLMHPILFIVSIWKCTIEFNVENYN
jgi:hypothetical protein